MESDRNCDKTGRATNGVASRSPDEKRDPEEKSADVENEGGKMDHGREYLR